MSQGIEPDDPIMGLDLSMARIGWAVVRGNRIDSGSVRLRGDLPDFLPIYRRWLRDMVVSHGPYVVAVEAPMVGHGTGSTKISMCLSGATDEVMRKYIGLYLPINQAQWKKDICGRGNISSAEKNAGMVQHILKRDYGIETETVDEADAICVALAARKKLGFDPAR